MIFSSRVICWFSFHQILVKHGADVNAGINDRSPLHYAVQSEAADCVEELLKSGARADTPQVSCVASTCFILKRTTSRLKGSKNNALHKSILLRFYLSVRDYYLCFG